MAARKAQVAPPSEPSSRLQALFAKTVVPEPYAVTDNVVVQPLTKTVREKLEEVNNRRMIGNFFLAESLKRSGEQAPTDADLNELTKIVKEATEEYDQLFFGDQLDKVREFFADRPLAHWEAFCTDIRTQFFTHPGPPKGECPHCGKEIDAELAGKEQQPST